MGRRSSSKVPQRKKPYRSKKGNRRQNMGCPNGRRWCFICSRRRDLEPKLRRSIQNKFAPLKGQRTECANECDCLICAGDGFAVLMQWKFQTKISGNRGWCVTRDKRDWYWPYTLPEWQPLPERTPGGNHQALGPIQEIRRVIPLSVKKGNLGTDPSVPLKIVDC